MTPPPVFPLRPLAKPGLFRQTPPMIFAPLTGLFGLGLAWRKALVIFAFPSDLAEMFLGAVTLLWVFAAFAYLAKVWRRPGVIRDEVKTLPGQFGLSSGVLAVYLLAAVLVPYAPVLALAVLTAGFGLHLGFALLLIATLRAGPVEARGVTPVWQLAFTGFIAGGLGAASLGLPALASALVLAAVPPAVTIWALSLIQLFRRIPPAPLRPLLALHLAPAGLLATVSAMQGQGAVATGFAVLGAVILVALVLSLGWITRSGFSAFWAAVTFPLAAFASALLSLGGAWQSAGLGLLVLAAGIIPVIAFKVMRAWMRGDLAARTNAARA